ncbi:MAG: hypothetical protein KDD67_06290 [Ignavibacteriae bacterium]|nr:hypothetical protein [Ignavibacteriota bacterium]MCB9215276.1 hypothetical protein [Ignavibacteria bacterium]
MELKQTGSDESVTRVEYVSTSVPANFVVVRAPKEGGEIGGVRPGDLVVVDQGAGGTEGATVVFRYEEKAVFGECVVQNGEWYMRDSSGSLRNASEMVKDGAVYRGAVRHVVRGKDEERG